MASIRLTELHIKNVKAPIDRSQVDLWDALLLGFSLRVTSKGTKTFSVKCRNASGKEQRVKLGRYPEISLADARKLALETKVQIAKGESLPAVIVVRQAPVITLTALAEEFLRRHASKNRTAKETERLLRREILKTLGARDFKSITKAEIIAILEKIVDRGSPILALQALAAVRKMFNWAVKQRAKLTSKPRKTASKTDHPGCATFPFFERGQLGCFAWKRLARSGVCGCATGRASALWRGI